MIHALRRGTNRAALAATAAFVMVATATPAHACGSACKKDPVSGVIGV